MLFSSTTFIFMFLTLLLILYFPIKNIKYRNIILLIFSLIFYSWGEPKYIFLMLLTVLIAYIFGLLIDKYRKDKKKSKLFLVISIMLILLNLFIFKYLDFSIGIINSIFKTNIGLTKLVLPIGISFYTFQILSYVIDLYWGKVGVQKNYFRLLLYVSFFPQLIAGPIVRYETVEKEISDRKTTLDGFISGFKRFIWGLAKKVIVANNVAIFCDYVYNNYSSYGSNILWVAAVCYTLQIYFDFSGYSDMAIGLGKMFGFNFLENFNYPYIATSINDFWRRWHISLSTFFRDYVYIPLGGNRVSKIKQIRNILIVWSLTGLWHGASYNFILWGLYYAAFLLIEKYLLKNILDKIPSLLKHIITLIIVNIGWVIFRFTDINEMFNVFGALIGKFGLGNLGSLYFTGILSVRFVLAFVLGTLVSIIPIKVEKSSKTLDLILIILFILSIIFILVGSYNPFIYYRF